LSDEIVHGFGHFKVSLVVRLRNALTVFVNWDIHRGDSQAAESPRFCCVDVSIKIEVGECGGMVVTEQDSLASSNNIRENSVTIGLDYERIVPRSRSQKLEGNRDSRMRIQEVDITSDVLAIAIETNISAASRTSCLVLRHISELAQSSRVVAWHKGECAVGVNISAKGACARKAVRGNWIRILSPWAGINTDRAREELSLWANIEAHFKATDTPSLILEGLIKIGCEGKTELIEIVVE
jgi:hypothetical protein